MCSSPLGWDEIESGSDVEASLPFKEENKMDVDNTIHDGPPLAIGLEVLAMVSPDPCKY